MNTFPVERCSECRGEGIIVEGDLANEWRCPSCRGIGCVSAAIVALLEELKDLEAQNEELTRAIDVADGLA